MGRLTLSGSPISNSSLVLRLALKGNFMKTILWCLLAVALAAAASAQENPLAKSSQGDWAKYLVTTKNETVPLMSSKDSPRWRTVSDVDEKYVRVEGYQEFGNRRVRSGGGVLCYFKDPYEPIWELGGTAKIQLTSSTKENLTINGKQYACTKIVRKVDKTLNENTAQASWVGTSTIWVCNDLPLGLAKMENVYEKKMSKSDKGQKIVETWILAEFGFKNWK